MNPRLPIMGNTTGVFPRPRRAPVVENTGKSTALSDGAFVRIVGVYQLSAGFFTGTSSPMTT